MYHRDFATYRNFKAQIKELVIKTPLLCLFQHFWAEKYNWSLTVLFHTALSLWIYRSIGMDMLNLTFPSYQNQHATFFCQQLCLFGYTSDISLPFTPDSHQSHYKSLNQIHPKNIKTMGFVVQIGAPYSHHSKKHGAESWELAQTET